jgi:hypothetical protein
VGDDGYPKPLFDEMTGVIDHSVAVYMRNHDYDLRQYAEAHWAQLGPKLSGRLHFSCGDEDSYLLNLPTRLFEQFLHNAEGPSARDAFQYGATKGHIWYPMNRAALLRQMAEQVARDTKSGALQ